jgi:hypothetical protein
MIVVVLQSIRKIANRLWDIVKADRRTYGGFETQAAADKGTIGRRLMNRLAECCWTLVPHAGAAGFKKNGGDMLLKCPVFYEAAKSICDEAKKHPQLDRATCIEIRNQLTCWINQLPPSSTFKFKTHIMALRDIVANHAKYLRHAVQLAETGCNRSVGDKVTDSQNYVVAPARDALWASFTPGDKAAAARINEKLSRWCPDFELFRIDAMLLSEKEKEHCATLANPDSLKYDRLERLFPLKGAGGPFIKRLDGYETYSEDEDEDGNPEAPSGDEMVEDSEEEAIRSDIELSLSDSDLD